jgi:hypothetical protein
MPEISRFYGIVVRMYYGDHPPPHFHVSYAEHAAKIDIDSLSIIAGKLPARALGLTIEWAALHQQELRDAFNRASNLAPPGKIAPLP